MTFRELTVEKLAALAKVGARVQFDVDAEDLLRVLEDAEANGYAEAKEAHSAPLTWRERLWTAPPETRIGPVELAEAAGRSRSWVYSKTNHNTPKSKRIPHRKLADGSLVFVVVEVREWLREQEIVMVPGHWFSK